MMPPEGLLVIILYISLCCDLYSIICYIFRKLNDSEKPPPLKPKYSRDYYHDIVRQRRISESCDEFKDTVSNERQEIQDKLSEAVRIFQNKRYIDSDDSNISENDNYESLNFPRRKVSRVYTSKATSFLLSQALLQSSRPLTDNGQDTIDGLPSRNISEDNWEAKRVRSRKISRVLKAPVTTSLLYARTLEEDSRLKSVPTFENPEPPEIYDSGESGVS